MSKSRQKPAQRRVGPSAAAAAAAEDHPLPDALLANVADDTPEPATSQQPVVIKQARPVADLQREEAALFRHAKEKEQLIRQQVQQLQQDKGESGCQQLLQQTIQKTKKKESELAMAKKRGDAMARETETLQLEHRKAISLLAQLESQSQTLREDTTRLETEVVNAEAEMAARRDEVRQRIDREVTDLREKLELQAKEDEPLAAENVELKKKFDAMRAEFDNSFKEYEQGWKTKEAETKVLVQKLTDQLRATQTLDAELMLGDRDLRQLRDEMAVYREQLHMYATKFDGFEAIAMKSEDVEKIAQMQKKQLQDKLDQLESEKKQANDLKSNFDRDAQQLRAKLQAVKKKIQLAEKAKLAAETRCRKEAEKKAAATGGVSDVK